MSFKMKELFQGGNQIHKLVEEATAETLDGSNWATNLKICEMINRDRVNNVELIRSVKRRLILKRPMAQYLSLLLLEMIVKNCDRTFDEVAAERVLDEMVRLIDDPHAAVNNPNKALAMIESWGESTKSCNIYPFMNRLTSKCVSNMHDNIWVYDVWDGMPEGPVFTGSHFEAVGLFLKALLSNFEKVIEEAENEVGLKMRCL
ncbi:hepatocyte growth factor-regulated tyrosine kinase substrate [Phtheirospermum japonicum]|uniref:Hepatocyte growth factor-regulated tyrosine kinase substrate n=1 Tax=Phtheirospermum japonicum TaxID=374723 RepID=A0A830BQM0_9LAMI|nr:hepatocyte growth factor-regulated tyrosine kinase substrate [Phtheirospermum japonicum]